MSKSKLTPMQLRGLAMLAREGAVLKAGSFRDDRRYIQMPHELGGQRIIATTYQALRDYAEPVSADRFEDEYRISDAGRVALVAQALGKEAGDRMTLALARANAIGQLMLSFAQGRGRAQRVKGLYEGIALEAILADMIARYDSQETYFAAILREYRAEVAQMLDEAMRAAGVEPPKREGQEAAPAPQYT